MSKKVTKKGLEFIKSWEGCSEVVYIDSGGEPTIGVGHLLTKSERRSGKIHIGGKGVIYRKGLTRNEIMLLLAKDLSVAKNTVNKLQKAINYRFKPYELDALTSFVFNIGSGAFDNSTMRRLFIRHDIIIGAQEFTRWCYDNGKKVQGLLNRRRAEQHLFLTGEYQNNT